MYEVKERTINRAKHKIPEEGFNAVTRHLSAYDLEKFLQPNPIPDDQELLWLLWEMGFDTKNFEVIEQYAYHRPVTALSNNPQYGRRWFGMERKDDQWVNSKYSSLDVRVATAGFSDLGSVIGMMARQSNFTGDLLDHMKNKRDVNIGVEVKNDTEDTDSNAN